MQWPSLLKPFTVYGWNKLRCTHRKVELASLLWNVYLGLYWQLVLHNFLNIFITSGVSAGRIQCWELDSSVHLFTVVAATSYELKLNWGLSSQCGFPHNYMVVFPCTWGLGSNISDSSQFTSLIRDPKPSGLDRQLFIVVTKYLRSNLKEGVFILAHGFKRF